MNKLQARIFQKFFKAGIRLTPFRMPEVLEGTGCSAKLPSVIKGLGYNKILIVTDANIAQLGLFDDMLSAMEKENISRVIYDKVTPDPTDTEVSEGLRIFDESGCEALVAFGGGSPIDCCKGIAAAAATRRKTIAQLKGLFKVGKKVPDIFAVPTTAGTGSETTITAVITVKASRHKILINDTALIPKVAALDSDLTKTMSPELTATTGMDALAHAVEAYTNRTYNTKTENQAAEDAVFLIYNNLYKAYRDSSDDEARHAMQKAAFHAGQAFTKGCVGYVHAVGHTLGGLYGVPHGLAMAVILPHVMRRFGAAAHERLARLAEVCGMGGRCDAEKAEKFIRWIEESCRKMNIPSGFDIIKDEDIPEIIRRADDESNPLYPTPVFWTAEDFRKLIDDIRL